MSLYFCEFDNFTFKFVVETSKVSIDVFKKGDVNFGNPLISIPVTTDQLYNLKSVIKVVLDIINATTVTKKEKFLESL